MAIRATILGSMLAVAAAVACAPALADPPRQAQGKPPAHAGGPHTREVPPPGWQKKVWRRGERLPLHELGDRYWVDDYLRYHLKAPPPGHRWVRQSDTTFLLVDVATGLILDALVR
jgi:Ni/Co efflux regulator RcnB